MNKSIKTEIVINASKETVWNILTDLNNYSKWNPFLIKSEGRVVKGERIKNTMVNGSRKFTFTPRILKVAPNQYFDWLGSMGFKGIFDGHHYFEIEEISGAQVKLVQGENFSGIFSGYLLKKIGSDTRNNFISMNQAVKRLAESKLPAEV